MEIVKGVSHVDHIPSAVLETVMSKFGHKKGFFIESVEVPGEGPSALYGPLAGDPPVREANVVYARRNGRMGFSRCVRRPQRPSNILTVIGCPEASHPGVDCILQTVFWGPCTEKEPYDLSLNGEEKLASLNQWREHALAITEEQHAFVNAVGEHLNFIIDGARFVLPTQYMYASAIRDTVVIGRGGIPVIHRHLDHNSVRGVPLENAPPNTTYVVSEEVGEVLRHVPHIAIAKQQWVDGRGNRFFVLFAP